MSGVLYVIILFLLGFFFVFLLSGALCLGLFFLFALSLSRSHPHSLTLALSLPPSRLSAPGLKYACAGHCSPGWVAFEQSPTLQRDSACLTGARDIKGEDVVSAHPHNAWREQAELYTNISV